MPNFYLYFFLFILTSNLISSKRAKCTFTKLDPSSLGLSGEVTFYQENKDSPVEVTGLISGLKEPDLQKHGFHIHEKNTIEDGCLGAGPHFNPYSTNHGPRETNKEHRHIGDLGNVGIQDNVIKFSYLDRLISLYENEDPNQQNQNILKRSCVFHQKLDDLGKGGDAESLKTGNAGARLGCGVIEEESVSQAAAWGILVIALLAALAYVYYSHFYKSSDHEQISEEIRNR
jgi:Cu-Zn family superoxide dismutase